MANSDKKKIRLSQTTKAESTNPALTPTANAETWHPAPAPDHQPKPTSTAPRPILCPRQHHPRWQLAIVRHEVLRTIPVRTHPMTNLIFRRIARHRETRVLPFAIDPFHNPAALAPRPRQRFRHPRTTQLDDPLRSARRGSRRCLRRRPATAITRRRRNVSEDFR